MQDQDRLADELSALMLLAGREDIHKNAMLCMSVKDLLNICTTNGIGLKFFLTQNHPYHPDHSEK